MKKLKYIFLMAVPVVLLSCGQSNTQNRENRNDGGMGSRDKSYQQNDQDRATNPGVQTDTSRYRSGSGSQGMGSSGRDTSTYQGSSSRSGQGSSTQQGSSSRSGSQGMSSSGRDTSTYRGSSSRSGQGSSTQPGSSSGSGNQGSSTQPGSSTRSGSQETNRSTNPDNTTVNPR